MGEVVTEPEFAQSAGIEYRVRWRDSEQRHAKKFGNGQAAVAYAALLRDTEGVTHVDVQARAVGRWGSLMVPYAC